MDIFEILGMQLTGSSGVVPKEVNKDGLQYKITGHGNCPVLSTDMAERYGITESQIKRFCNQGCSVVCMDEFEELVKKTLKRRK